SHRPMDASVGRELSEAGRSWRSVRMTPGFYRGQRMAGRSTGHGILGESE
ncbi:MAG: hypothetical protein ACI8PQ_002118, partial [Planctomycetota bacterium]